MLFKSEKSKMITADRALKGRETAMSISGRHTITGNSMVAPYPEGYEIAMFGLGCFWGAERKFWTLPGVHTTAVGYSAGYTPNPTYREVCSGSTGHNEVVLVAFNSRIIGYNTLLKIFWEAHNPTQGMRQGNDQGTQYRSGIYTFGEKQFTLAKQSKDLFQDALSDQAIGIITTEIQAAKEFYFAEEYHQQYLDKNPNGYCGLDGCGIELEMLSSLVD